MFINREYMYIEFRSLFDMIFSTSNRLPFGNLRANFDKLFVWWMVMRDGGSGSDEVVGVLLANR